MARFRARRVYPEIDARERVPVRPRPPFRAGSGAI